MLAVVVALVAAADEAASALAAVAAMIGRITSYCRKREVQKASYQQSIRQECFWIASNYETGC